MATRTKTGSTNLKFKVRIVVEKDDPGYHAFAPSLPGMHMPGDTVQEALDNAREAAALMLKVMIEDGEPIPIDLANSEKHITQNETVIPVFSGVEEILIKI